MHGIRDFVGLQLFEYFNRGTLEPFAEDLQSLQHWLRMSEHVLTCALRDRPDEVHPREHVTRGWWSELFAALLSLELLLPDLQSIVNHPVSVTLVVPEAGCVTAVLAADQVVEILSAGLCPLFVANSVSFQSWCGLTMALEDLRCSLGPQRLSPEIHCKLQLQQEDPHKGSPTLAWEIEGVTYEGRLRSLRAGQVQFGDHSRSFPAASITRG